MSWVLDEEEDFDGGFCIWKEEMGRNIGDRSSVHNGDGLSFSSRLG